MTDDEPGRLAATADRLRDEVARATASDDGRALIDVAKGVLVERLRCGVGDANVYLESVAEQQHLSPLELASRIVAEAARETGSPAVAEQRSVSEDTQVVAQSIVDQALVPLGATAVAVWVVRPDASLVLAASAGFTGQDLTQWRYVPPGVRTVARRALTERRTVWLADLAAAGLASIGSTAGGRVAAPAAVAGQVVTVLEVCWAQPLGPRSPGIERQVDALAELCARTLDTTVGEEDVRELSALAEATLDSAVVLTPSADATDFVVQNVNSRFTDLAGRPAAIVAGKRLTEAYPRVSAEDSLFDKVQRVHATGEPFRAEQSVLTTLVDEVPVTVVADLSIVRHGNAVLLMWRIQDETARLASLLQHAQRLGRIGGFDENVLTGEVTWNSQLFDLYGLPTTDPPVPLALLATQAHPDDGPTIGRFLRTVLHHRRPASATFRLRRPDSVVRQVRVVAEPVLDADNRLLHVRGAYQDVSAQHWTEVALAATQDQLAQTEQHAAERDKLALQLQRAIMPSSPDPIDTFGLRIAVRYLPAESGALVGGDWYDAVVLPSKKILLSVGDIAGHGIEAATGMVVLRNALRGLATTGAGPGQLLAWLNLVAHHLTNHLMASAVCGLYDPETRVLRWARAGHPPPILVRGGKAELLPVLRGTMLGVVAEAEYVEDQVTLRSEDMLLLYTDGLVERKDQPIDDSLAELLGLAETATGPLEQQLDYLLRYNNANTDDDTCAVAIRLN